VNQTEGRKDGRTEGGAASPFRPSLVPSVGRLLAVDWGEKRIGLALSDECQLLAQPLTTLTRRTGKRFPMARLIALVKEHAVTGAVVGLPLAADGSEAGAAGQARALAEAIARHSGLAVDLWDERFTTARALQAVREMGRTAKGRRAELDALAAAILMQHYLDARRANLQGGVRNAE
jgi:putative Holliday junction resolvase